MVHHLEEGGGQLEKINEQAIGLLEQANCWYAESP